MANNSCEICRRVGWPPDMVGWSRRTVRMKQSHFKGAVIIVPWASAAGLCNEGLIAIEGDHSDIVKPSPLSDKAHLALRAAIIQTLENRPIESTRLIPGNGIELNYDSRGSAIVAILSLRAVRLSARARERLRCRTVKSVLESLNSGHTLQSPLSNARRLAHSTGISRKTGDA